MKTIKNYYFDTSLYYKIVKKEIVHGLLNNNHRYIGYYYQGKWKGFWIREKK